MSFGGKPTIKPGLLRRTLAGWVVLAALAGGCRPAEEPARVGQPETPVRMAARAYYDTPGPGPANLRLNLEITNQSGAPLEFDHCLYEFQADGPIYVVGQKPQALLQLQAFRQAPGVTSTTWQDTDDSTKAALETSAEQPEPLTWKLPAGATVSLACETMGSAGRLFPVPRQGEVVFTVHLQSRGRTVAGPFHGILPEYSQFLNPTAREMGLIVTMAPGRRVQEIQPPPVLPVAYEAAISRTTEDLATAEYVVLLTLRNGRKEPVAVHSGTARFVPSLYGDPVGAYLPVTVPGPGALPPGGTHRMRFTTQGQARTLLKRAGEFGNLYFYLRLEAHGEYLSWPLRVGLPPLKECPPEAQGSERLLPDYVMPEEVLSRLPAQDPPASPGKSP